MPEDIEKYKIYRFRGFELNSLERLLLRKGERVSLTPRMFDLLLRLVEADGHLVSKETLLSEVWADAAVEEGNLNRTISTLRKALGETKNENRYIETVPKVGYRFIAGIEKAESKAESPDSPEISVLAQSTAFPSASSPTKSKYLIIGTISAAICLAILAGVYFLSAKSETKLPVKKSGDEIVRLTKNQMDEEVVMWTNNNEVRFTRFITNMRGESFVINPDGSGEQRDHPPIKNFFAGFWSPDGRRIIFSKIGEKPTELYLANADGTNEIKLPFRPGPMDWSPDGTQIVINNNLPGAGNAEIFLYDLKTGKQTNISNHPAFDANPSFSPDGTQIIFNSVRDGQKNTNIYLMNADGSNVRRLTDHPAGEVFPVFTPDGTQILFNSRRENEKVGLYLMNLGDKQPPIKISDTSYNSETRQRPFSPDGTRIVFMSDKEGDKFNIYLMNFEPFKPTPVLSFDDRDVQSPSFSPDGGKIVYQAKMEDKSGELCLFETETQTTKTLLKTENFDLAPAFSPDGNLIAFNCKIGGNTEICTIKPDGSDLRNLTDNKARDTNPTFSPDGKEIIFASNREEDLDKYQLFRMNPDGENLRRVTQKSGYEMTPAWSPDGAHLAFSADRVDGKSRALDIFLLNLINANEEKNLAVRRFHDTFPAFSPDGKQLAFVSQADGNSEIYLMKADGTGLLRLTRNAAEDTTPTFSKDGKRIYFSSNRDGKFAIYQIELP